MSLMNKKLEQHFKSGTEIDVYLKNGIRLCGRIMEYDEDSIVISSAKIGLEDGILIARGALATVQRTTNRDKERGR
jgi:sRNA-binding regulator protein Hfq